MSIRKIAKEHQVSAATVSLVLNNRPGVKAEKRQIIQQALIANGYTLKNIPQSTLPPKTICFIKFRADTQNDDFASAVLESVEHHARNAGYSLEIVIINEKNYRRVLSGLDFNSIYGIIFLASSFSADCLAYAKGIPLPTVYIDIEDNSQGINSINANYRQGAHIAVEYLHRLGHHQLGYLRYQQNIGCLKQRFLAFRQEIDQFGLDLLPEHIFSLDVYQEIEPQVQAYLAKQSSLPTVFFADNDVIASGCVYALQAAGLRVPENISVLGFDNSKISSLFKPRLSTIDVNINEIGKMAVYRLCMLLHDQAPIPVQINTPVSLVIRDTTTFSAHLDG